MVFKNLSLGSMQVLGIARFVIRASKWIWASLSCNYLCQAWPLLTLMNSAPMNQNEYVFPVFLITFGRGYCVTPNSEECWDLTFFQFPQSPLISRDTANNLTIPHKIRTCPKLLMHQSTKKLTFGPGV